MGDDALVQELASELSRLKLELETEKMCSSSQRLVIAQQEREVKETAKQHAGEIMQLTKRHSEEIMLQMHQVRRASWSPLRRPSRAFVERTRTPGRCPHGAPPAPPWCAPFGSIRTHHVESPADAPPCDAHRSKSFNTPTRRCSCRSRRSSAARPTCSSGRYRVERVVLQPPLSSPQAEASERRRARRREPLSHANERRGMTRVGLPRLVARRTRERLASPSRALDRRSSSLALPPLAPRANRGNHARSNADRRQDLEEVREELSDVKEEAAAYRTAMDQQLREQSVRHARQWCRQRIRLRARLVASTTPPPQLTRFRRAASVPHRAPGRLGHHRRRSFFAPSFRPPCAPSSARTPPQREPAPTGVSAARGASGGGLSSFGARDEIRTLS